MHPYRKGHERWNLEEPNLEESSANARKDVIDLMVAGREGADREMCKNTALSLRGKSLAIN